MRRLKNGQRLLCKLHASYDLIPVAHICNEQEAPLISMEEDEQGGAGSQNRHGSFLRAITTLQTAAAPAWELQGLQARVARRVRHLSRCAAGSSLPHCTAHALRPEGSLEQLVNALPTH